MNRARVLYHLVRADFLERTRRYSFLLTAAFAVYLGYAVYAGKVVIKLDDYRGIYNSAWLGSLMTLVATTFVSLIGFYIVKNAIQRDQETRVGQILATTPMSKAFYTLAKTISNFAVLIAMVAIMALAALFMQLLRAEDPHVNLWFLVSPFVLLALPAMAFTSALAVLFETVPGLRGGLGNVIYFFLWTALLVGGGVAVMDNPGARSGVYYFTDFTGVPTVMSEMQSAVRQIDLQYKGGASLTIGDSPPTKRFLWIGLRWKPIALAARLAWLGLSVLVALISSLFFHRFDPAREWWPRPRNRPEANTGTEDLPAASAPAIAQLPTHLTPLLRTESKTRFASLVAAELRLVLQGRRWWGYVVAAGLFVACVASPLDASRGGVLLAAWLWPILLWSQMGMRESRYATQSLIFSSERALWRQLPAVWVAGVIIAALTGGGLAIRLLIAGDALGLATWLAGALFIPSLALALGVWSGSSKPFEALYTVWWYVGPANHVPGLDFMGTTARSGRPITYFAATAVLLAACYLGRRARIAYV